MDSRKAAPRCLPHLTRRIRFCADERGRRAFVRNTGEITDGSTSCRYDVRAQASRDRVDDGRVLFVREDCEHGILKSRRNHTAQRVEQSTPRSIASEPRKRDHRLIANDVERIVL